MLHVSQGDADCHSMDRLAQSTHGGDKTDAGTGRSSRLMSGFQGRMRTIRNITNSSKWFIKEMKPQQ